VRKLIFRAVFGSRLPYSRGSLRIPGLRKPITIRRDKSGIPYIEAESERDAHFGCGFVQGQDRGFQLETLLRIGRGTLAELVGPGGLPADRMSRRIGFARSSAEQLKVLDADILDILEAFVAGVNAGHSLGVPAKPHEFAVLGGTPTPWTPADVLATLKLISFSLPGNWDVELARLRMLRADGRAAVEALDPSWVHPTPDRAHPTPDLVRHAPLDALARDLALFQEFVPTGGGSNNWLIAGARTASGKPILANDPHLRPDIPPPWYLFQVRTPAGAFAGAALAGSPGATIGHNGFCAWGVTAGLTDNTDLFIETLDATGTSVRDANGAFTPCPVVREVIRVKGKPDHIEDVLITPRGPVISPLLPEVREVLSLRAVWLDAHPIRGFFDAPAATSFETFRRPFAAWPGLPLNALYAAADGETGYQQFGQVPVRKVGYGMIPLPGDTLGVGWETELLPFDKMPFARNPQAGYYATANDDPHLRPESTTTEFLGADFIDPYRANTIRDELARQPDGWDVAACQALQLSVRSMVWEEIRGIVVGVPDAAATAREALDLLKDWDGHVEANSPAATIFELFMAEMCIRVAKAKAPRSWELALGGSGPGLLAHNLFGDRRTAHLVKLLKSQPPGWFARSWPEEMADALAEIIPFLRKKYGPGPKWWQWGDLRPLRGQHPILGKHWLLGPIFNAPSVPCGGDCNTISQAGALPLHPLEPTGNMANLRIVFDTADFSNTRVALCGGQSGNPYSPHHLDLFWKWQAGDGAPLLWTPQEILKGAKATLRLEVA